MDSGDVQGHGEALRGLQEGPNGPRLELGHLEFEFKARKKSGTPNERKKYNHPRSKHISLFKEEKTHVTPEQRYCMSI